MEDLGLGEGRGEPVSLISPPQVLRRALPRLRELAESHTASLEPQWAKDRELKERNRLVSEACEAVLVSLDETEIGG